jgi:dihydropyrimidinase
MKTLIRNGRVATGGRLETVDLLVEDAKIAALGRFPDLRPDRAVDAAGLFVLPGFLDFHTHIADRIGRFELADGYSSGTEVAVLNGITTVCTFVTQGLGESLPEALRRAQAKASGSCHGDVLWHLTPVSYEAGDLADQRALVEAGFRTWKFYTTYRAAGLYCDPQRLEDNFRRLGPLGARILMHCEDDGCLCGVDSGSLDLARAASHAKLRPGTAEARSVEDLVALAAKSGTPLHVVHVSTLEAAERLARARSQAEVTCETCPQYLWLDDTWLARPDGHRWICSPPLRDRREAFRALARNGAFDLLATDHCAFTTKDKDAWDGRDVRTVANGLAGIGALPHLAWRLWADDPDRAALELALRLSLNPARLAGVDGRKGDIRPGLDADLVLLDPDGPERPVLSTLSGSHETYPGFNSNLAIREVYLRGEPVAREAALVTPGVFRGQALQPRI